MQRIAFVVSFGVASAAGLAAAHPARAPRSASARVLMRHGVDRRLPLASDRLLAAPFVHAQQPDEAPRRAPIARLRVR